MEALSCERLVFGFNLVKGNFNCTLLPVTCSDVTEGMCESQNYNYAVYITLWNAEFS